ncbi:MAG: aspartate/glutamate racemase family protein [Spirochaetales bacterium]|nr:aspartate/glutamate racemase family protein [Spirochaetales bacterium]
MGGRAVIVLGGGVGPMAGVALHRMIIENTRTDGTDQSHLTVHHYSCSALVPDRTAWLLDSTAPDPAAGMADVFSAAARALDGRAAVGGVPCNTFHAPAIFDRFLSMLDDRRVGIRVVNMLEESLAMIRSALPAGSVVGVMSTTGTRLSGVYDAMLERAGYRILYVPQDDQDVLHASIYDTEWGIKAVSPVSQRASDTVSGLAAHLVDAGADAIVLACTELPLALSPDAPGGLYRGVPLVDPVLALARALIREACPEQLLPL